MHCGSPFAAMVMTRLFAVIELLGRSLRVMEVPVTLEAPLLPMKPLFRATLLRHGLGCCWRNAGDRAGSLTCEPNNCDAIFRQYDAGQCSCCTYIGRQVTLSLL